MRNLDELISEASEKLLGLFVTEASPGLAGYKGERQTQEGSYPARSVPEETLLQRPQQHECLWRWKFK